MQRLHGHRSSTFNRLYSTDERNSEVSTTPKGLHLITIHLTPCSNHTSAAIHLLLIPLLKPVHNSLHEPLHQINLLLPQPTFRQDLPNTCALRLSKNQVIPCLLALDLLARVVGGCLCGVARAQDVEGEVGVVESGARGAQVAGAVGGDVLGDSGCCGEKVFCRCGGDVKVLGEGGADGFEEGEEHVVEEGFVGRGWNGCRHFGCGGETDGAGKDKSCCESAALAGRMK